MTYVVARYTFGDETVLYTVLAPQEWQVLEHIPQVPYEKLFETETVEHAEALIALMPEGNVLT